MEMREGVRDNARHALPVCNERRSEFFLFCKPSTRWEFGHAGDELARLYARESSPEVKKRIIQGLFVGRDATRLVELAKAEKDMELKKDIVQKLSMMKSKEATDYLVELLK